MGPGSRISRIFLDRDSEPVGAQRVAESERSLGVVVVAAPSVVEQDPLLLVAHVDGPTGIGWNDAAANERERVGVGR